MKQKGFVAISVVIILISVVIAIGTSVTLLSIGEGQSGLSLFKGEENLDFVEGCAEDGLLKSRSDSNYSGGTINRPSPEGTCNITINKAGTPWIMTATIDGANPVYKRSIEVQYTRAATGITLTSWKEI